MNNSNDYRGEMSGENLTHSNIERLLSRDNSLISDDDLRRFIASLSLHEQPPQPVEQMATALAATARASSSHARRRGFRRLAVLVSVGAIIMSLGGVAIAADGAVPGDALYPVDRALERFGLGAGGVDERIAEFDEVIVRGHDGSAFALLGEAIEQTDGADLEKLQRHLELAATKTSPSAVSAQEKVADLQTFISAYKGPDDAINGKAFGEGVADIATGSTELPGPDADLQPGHGKNVPGQEGQGAGRSGAAPGQQPEGPPGHSDEASNNADEGSPPGPQESPGNSGKAPGQQEDEGPGNSENARGRQGGNGSG